MGQKYDPPENLKEILNSIRVELFRNDKISEEGLGSNVLDGPISALKYCKKVSKIKAESQNYKLEML